MGQQYLDNGWFGILVTLTLVFFVIVNILRATRGKKLYIRRISGLNSIDEAVGRATELGRPVLMVPGLTDTTVNAKSMQAINIFSYVSRVAARFSNPILVCCFNASIFAVAQEVIRDVYQQEGLTERYDVDSVRFVSDRQFAFAAGVAGLILREQAAACFFMGEFYAESLILAETANSVGAIQVASSTELTQTPFFIAACDYVLIGDEFYAASAYLTREPVLVGSLVGQDWCKMALAAFVLLGVLINTIGIRGTTTQQWTEGNWKQVKERPLKKSDTIISRLMNPDPDPNLKIEREKYPADQLPSKAPEQPGDAK